MAGIVSRTKEGRTLLEVRFRDKGKERAIRLGAVTMTAANAFRDRLERLQRDHVAGVIDGGLHAWANALPEQQRRHLVAAGLIQSSNKPTGLTVGQWCRDYLDGFEGAASSKILIERTVQLLGAYSSIPLDKLTADDAHRWHGGLYHGGATGKRSEATVRKHVRNAKAIFNAAIDRELIARNPCRNLPSSSVARDRERYIEIQTIEAVIAACPSVEWRILFALARFAGLRVRSETDSLKWEHVDMERRRLTVFAKKTGATRIVPIVPRLHEILSEQTNRTGRVVPIHTIHGPDLRIIALAAKRWPARWQALRQAAATDFARQFPAHVVASWMGHSAAVSAKYYLQVPDDMFDRAVATH